MNIISTNKVVAGFGAFFFLLGVSISMAATEPSIHPKKSNKIEKQTLPFNLFSKNRSVGNDQPVRKLPPPPRKNPGKTKKPKFITKKFVLRGTTILGSHKYAMLQQVGKKKIFILRLQQGSATPFPSDPRYQLDEINPRSVKIRYPLASPCKQDDKALNIHCVDQGKYAQLTIVRQHTGGKQPKTYLSATDKERSKRKKTNIIGYFPKSSKKTDVRKDKGSNPFFHPVKLSKEEMKKRRAELLKDPEYRRRREQYKNFKPRRIPKEEVPPGMKVVKTPFGDMLVPE